MSASAVAMILSGATLGVAGEDLAAAQSSPPPGTNFSVSIERGPGTIVKVTVTNDGPRPVYAAPGSSGVATSGLSLTFDQGSSGSKYQVATTVAAAPHWTCGAAYDVVNCYEPGAFGVGQSMDMSVPMNLCYPSGHAYVLYYWTNDSGEVGNHVQNGSFSGPGGGCTSTHIGSLKLSVSDYVRELAATYRRQVESLAEQKDQVEASLPGLQARIDVASAKVASAGGLVATLVAKVAETQAFADLVNREEQALPPSVRAELQARDSLDHSIAALQDQIVQANQSGNSALAASLGARLHREESQLAEINRGLAAKAEQLDQTVERWVAQLRILKNQLFAARLAQVSALGDLAAANAALQGALGERSSLDKQLFDVAEAIAQLGAGVSEVSVISNLGTTTGADQGVHTTVFNAKLPANPLVIGQLDSDIAEVGNALADLEAQRQAALGRFLSAEQAAVAALDNVTQVVWSTAKKKAAVDFVFNLIDVVKAAKNGGLIGASTETLKKVVETLVKEYAIDNGPGKYGSKGALDFDANFSAKLTEAYVGKVALKTGVERLVKDTVSKKGKDALNKSLGTLVFQKVYGTVPALYEQAGAQLTALGTPSVEEIKQIQAAVDARAAQFSSLGGTYEGQPLKAAKGIGTKIGDLAKNLAKDLAKNAIKTYFDLQEQQAWAAYFEKEIVARAYYPLYAAIADAYWATYDEYDSLLDQKAQLLGGYSPIGDARVTTDDYFPLDATLGIFVLGIDSGSNGAPVSVMVGGIPAKYEAGYGFVFDAHFLPASQKGVGLEVRLR